VKANSHVMPERSLARLGTAVRSVQRQRGIGTLIVALVMLAILTVVVLFATQVGMFEQRTAANQNFAKLAAQTSEANLNIAAEFIKASNREISKESGTGWLNPAGAEDGRPSWTRCSAATGAAARACATEPDATRRAQMWVIANLQDNARFRVVLAGMGGVVLKAGGVGADFEGFDVVPVVHALLCRFERVDPTIPQPNRCVLEPDPDNLGPVAVTLVSEAAVRGAGVGTFAGRDGASATLKQTFANYRTIGSAPNVPIIASGSVNLQGGTADIVASPNSGGFGVALSVWSADKVSFDASGGGGGTGAIKSCHLGEWLTNPNNASPQRYDGITICSNCKCDGLAPGKGLLSGKYTAQGSGAGRDKGVDILDTADDGANPPIQEFPRGFFPRPPYDDPNDPLDDSLFEYVFNIDVVDREGKCVDMQDGKCQDTIFLEENAIKVANCGGLTANSTGMYWSEGACRLPNGQVGTPSEPVVIVADSEIVLSAGTVFYGMIFMRSPAGGALRDLEFTANGSPQLYGAIIAEGSVKLRGSPGIIYNQTVLNNIANSDAFSRFGPVPSSWSDDVRL
jgi:hypothetical protein